MVSQLWADVKYHVPTGFGFSPKASGFHVFCFGAPRIYPQNRENGEMRRLNQKNLLNLVESV